MILPLQHGHKEEWPTWRDIPPHGANTQVLHRSQRAGKRSAEAWSAGEPIGFCSPQERRRKSRNQRNLPSTGTNSLRPRSPSSQAVVTVRRLPQCPNVALFEMARYPTWAR